MLLDLPRKARSKAFRKSELGEAVFEIRGDCAEVAAHRITGNMYHALKIFALDAHRSRNSALECRHVFEKDRDCLRRRRQQDVFQIPQIAAGIVLPATR